MKIKPVKEELKVDIFEEDRLLSTIKCDHPIVYFNIIFAIRHLKKFKDLKSQELYYLYST
jgi:hypothetical protein